MDDPEIPVQLQAELLRISRSSLYYQPVGPSAKEIAIKHRIDELYTKYPFYGSRRMTVSLKREGRSISRPTVQKYMREMGLEAIYPKPRLSQPGKRHTIYPYLLKDITLSRPNQVWGVDITYIRLRSGWLYLFAVIDWFSRFVLSWELDQTLAVGFVLSAMKKALAYYTPEICNSDQGSQFTGVEFTGLLKEHQVQISMDGKGRAIDNIFTERLWRSLKYEEVYLKDYASPREARQSIGAYFEFYNYERPHQSLEYQSPASIFGVDYTTFSKEKILLTSPLFVSNFP